MAKGDNSKTKAVCRTEKRNLLAKIKQEDLEMARLTREQAAEYLDISVVTLWRFCKLNQISLYRIGHRIFFYKKDLDYFIENSKVPAKEI